MTKDRPQAGDREHDAAAPHAERALALYASTGNRLRRYTVDPVARFLAAQEAIALPDNVQYAWPHPSGRFLYVACSNGAPGSRGDRHSLSALRIAADGALALHGPTVALPGRPVHVTTDAVGRHALLAYNDPGGLSVHAIRPDGTLGRVVQQQAALDVGIFAHQVRVLPSNRTAILVTRGNDATPGRPEDPGALKVFDWDDGQLRLRASIAPGRGLGYGPRHVAFHPQLPRLFVSLERQNLLHVHDMAGDTIAPAPSHVVTTLEKPAQAQPAQRAGTLHLHPDGRYLYLANRADGTVQQDGERIYAGGENSIAVFALDERTGAPRLTQTIDTRGIAPRTFALDPGGRMLVAANSKPLDERIDGVTRAIPQSLAVFAVGDDGRLDYVDKHDVAAGDGTLFWMGMMALPREAA